MIQTTERTLTASTVAQALGMPLGTLRLWNQRGYTPEVQRESGDWRRYNLQDVAYLAALYSVALQAGPHTAGEAMAHIVATAPKEWSKAVQCASEGRHHVFVTVARVTENPSDHVLYQFWHSPLGAEEKIGGFVELVQGWETDGHRQGAVDRPIRPAYVALYDVGPAIHAALQNLARGTE